MSGIGKLSQATGCSVETIRYYEKLGLIPAPNRSEGGHRQYLKMHQSRLLFIRQSRDLGFSLEQVRELINLSEDADRTCDITLDLVQSQLTSVEEKIERLQVMREGLLSMACGCRNTCSGARAPDCSIVTILAAPMPVHRKFPQAPEVWEPLMA